MPDDSLPLVPLSGSQLVRHGSGGWRILEDMVSSTLTTSKQEGALVPRYRIGDIDFCEPDYRQMLLWAERFDKNPTDFLASLLGNEGIEYYGSKGTLIVNGRIHRLSWDMVMFPEFRLDYGPHLALDYLEFFDHVRTPLTPPPTSHHLRRYFQHSIEERLLKRTPQNDDYSELTIDYDCPIERRLAEHRGGKQKTLSLSCPTLRVLTIRGTNFIDLECIDLSSLKELRVSHKPGFIKSLSAESCPALEGLDCHGTVLQKLVLRDYESLSWLDCSQCGLETLNLTFSQNSPLKQLNCRENELRGEELLLAFIFGDFQKLEKLDCSFNHLSILHLDSTPNIRRLSCEGNMLEELDIRPLQHLESLTYDRDRTRLIQRPDQNF